MIRRLACLVVLVTAAAPLPAQMDGPGPTRLTVRPAAAPDPALKYQLLPELKDMTPGNAALLYQRAHSPEWWSSHFRQRGEAAKMESWLELPLKQLPIGEMRYLESWPGLQEVDRAARREYCDWEMTQRVRTEGYSMLIPDVQGFREYARFLSMRARLELAEGKLDKAVYTFQTGLALARDVANAPTFINVLVGLAVAHQMADRLEDLMQLPDAPNLYWALAVLPEPFIDLRKPIQGERLFLEAEFPELKTIASRVWGADEQQTFMSHLERLGDVADNWGIKGPVDRKLAVIGVVIKLYPEAKRFLVAQRRKAAEVEAMPALQVVLLYSQHNTQRIQDDYYKWVSFPYWQARVGLEKADREIRLAVQRLDIMPFGLLIPAVSRVYTIRVRLDRRLAALRCIEAIRLHAAAHDGKPPAALGAITEVPVPVDPVSGRGFDYTVDGQRVTLRESRGADGLPVLLGHPLHYEVTFQR